MLSIFVFRYVTFVSYFLFTNPVVLLLDFSLKIKFQNGALFY